MLALLSKPSGEPDQIVGAFRGAFAQRKATGKIVAVMEGTETR